MPSSGSDGYNSAQTLSKTQSTICLSNRPKNGPTEPMCDHRAPSAIDDSVCVGPTDTTNVIAKVRLSPHRNFASVLSFDPGKDRDNIGRLKHTNLTGIPRVRSSATCSANSLK